MENSCGRSGEIEVVTMSSRAERRCEPAKNRLVSRLTSIASSWRTAKRDRRRLIAFDDRMLLDIGLARDDILHGAWWRTKGYPSPQGAAWRVAVWTIVVIMVSLLVALVAPDGSKVDPWRTTSCALFPHGTMVVSSRGLPNSQCSPSFGDCAQITGAPKYGC